MGSGRVKDMGLVHLSAALQRLRPFKAPMIVVAVSALLALLFTLATMPSASEPPRAAGEAAMQLVGAEHHRVAASIRQILAAVTAEEEARSADMRVAAAEAAPAVPATPAIVAKPVRVAQVVPLPKASPVVAPPLPLQAVAVAQPERGRPIVTRTRAVLAAVGQIPQWLRASAENVADWAVTAPAETIARLPERRFL
jgi:hypothetical protein